MVQKDEKKSRFLLNMAFYAVILALVFLFFRYFLKLMMPFFLALVFASLSRPLSRFLSSRVRWKKNEKGERVAMPRRVHLNPSLAGILSVLLLFALLGSLLVLVIIQLGDSIGSLVAAIPGIYTNDVLPVLENSAAELLELAGRIDESVMNAVAEAIPGLISSLGSTVTKFSMNAVAWISSLAGRIPSFLVNTIICLIATVFISVDFDGIRRFILCNLPEKPLQMVIDVKDTFLDIIWQFIRSYFVIFLITATEITAGLWIIGMESPLFFGVVIAVFDAFPIVGSGMFLLPWGVFKLVAGKLWQGVGLVALYLVITVVRQIIEPRIVGKHVGLRPIVTLVCMYAGTRLFGGIGLLALPVMVAILTDMNERGLIHLFRHPEKEEDASVGEEIV